MQVIYKNIKYTDALDGDLIVYLLITENTKGWHPSSSTQFHRLVSTDSWLCPRIDDAISDSRLS